MHSSYCKVSIVKAKKLYAAEKPWLASFRKLSKLNCMSQLMIIAVIFIREKRRMMRGGCIAVITRMNRGGPPTSTAVQLDLEATNEFVSFLSQIRRRRYWPPL